MLHSLIINQGTNLAKNQYLQSINLNPSSHHPDLLELKPDPSIGIKDIKAIISFLSKKPYQAKLKSVIIHQAHLLTLPAQNALLKTLEEPPAHSQIILLTNRLNQLLPTINSRCQLIKLDHIDSNQSLEKQKKIYDQIIKASLGERLAIINPYSASKKTAINWVYNQLLFIKSSLPKSTSLTRHLHLTHQLLQANVNPKLTLENLILHYPKT